MPVLGSLALSMRFPDRSPVLDKNRAPMGPEIISSTAAGAWRKAPMAFPDSSSVLDRFQSALCCKFRRKICQNKRRAFSGGGAWGEQRYHCGRNYYIINSKAILKCKDELQNRQINS